jgi:hypothetical protein
MNNKVYYGEYSLKHWVELILKGNIMLPWYQRSFVWEKGQIEELIKTLDNNQFVPPVIIGAVREKGEWENYILDGQQRLTSILFAKCNKYIDKKDYTSEKPDAVLEATIADDVTDNEDDIQDVEIKMIKWNFKELIKDNQINTEELKNSFYKKLFPNDRDEKFFNEHFLGFAYIKPNNNVKDEDQSQFYSDIFRNINMSGTKLTRLEARKSLYFLKETLKDFFAPKFLDSYKVITSSKESGLLDFIKYLSILSQYEGNNNNLLRYGGRDWEKNENYYKMYIKSVVDSVSSNELKFSILYPANPYSNERMDKFETSILQLDIPESFDSIINMDMYFFGLINEIVFKNNKLDETKKDKLKDELEEKIKELSEIENHKYNPSALKYLKSRIAASIAIYEKYRKVEANEQL